MKSELPRALVEQLDRYTFRAILSYFQSRRGRMPKSRPAGRKRSCGHTEYERECDICHRAKMRNATNKRKRMRRRRMIAPLTEHDVVHGQVGECPTCHAPGRFDVETAPGEPVAFEDAIWFSHETSEWECTRCWTK